MSKVIEFKRSKAGDPADLSTLRISHLDRLTHRSVSVDDAPEDVNHHWGVALALATWPVCFGAGLVLMALD